jgi:hypothetical protein
MKLSPEVRRDAIAAASCAAITGEEWTLRDGHGRALTGGNLDDLLDRAVRRERVEIEIDILAYEQGAVGKDGKPLRNRSSVRFRDKILTKLGRSGTGTPFLRDHRQGDSSARGGTVIASETTKLDDGRYQIRQTVRLTEPTAVERALRGLMSAVSIGWRPTGPVHCTLCKAEVLTECLHLPGDHDEESDSHVEWEFQDAELIETSEVPVPGVQTAGIESIRAALSAATFRGSSPQESPDMSKLVGVATLLGLAATAGEDEITSAVTVLRTERDALSAQLAAEQKRALEISAQLAHHEAQLARQAEDVWIADGIKAGKIMKGAHENALRAYFQSNPDGARAMLVAAPVITPVGQGSQLQPMAGAVTEATQTALQLSQLGVNHPKARAFAKAFGAKDPDKALALYAQSMQEG